MKTIYASICGTDVAVYQHGPGTGHKIAIGCEFGHEAICRVATVGEKATDFHVGQRVYPYPLLVTGDPGRVGTIGIAASIALKEFGCREVLVCDLSDFRLERVRRLGFPTCNTGREHFSQRASDVFGAAHGLNGLVPDVDIYLDAAGAPSVLE